MKLYKSSLKTKHFKTMNTQTNSTTKNATPVEQTHPTCTQSSSFAKHSPSNDNFHIPQELILHIFSYLTPEVLCKIALVCKEWRLLADHPYLWKPHLKTIRKELPSGETDKEMMAHPKQQYKLSLQTLRNLERGTASTSSFPICCLPGSRSEEQHTKLHQNAVTAYLLQGGNLFTAAEDLSVKIWGMNTGDCLYTFLPPSLLAAAPSNLWTRHKETPHHLAQHRNHLLAVASTITLIWNMNTGVCIHILRDQGPRGAHPQFAILDNYFFKSSQNDTVMMWDIDRGEHLHSFTGQSIRPPYLMLQGNTLFTGSSDGMIRIWNIVSKEREDILTEHRNAITGFAWHNESFLFSGDLQGGVKMWDLQNRNTGESVDNFDWNTGPVESLITQNSWLIVQHARSIEMWDIRTRAHLRTFSYSGQEQIHKLSLQKKYLYGGNRQGLVVWNIENGKTLFKEHSVGDGHNRSLWQRAFCGFQDGVFLSSLGDYVSKFDFRPKEEDALPVQPRKRQKRA